MAIKPGYLMEVGVPLRADPVKAVAAFGGALRAALTGPSLRGAGAPMRYWPELGQYRGDTRHHVGGTTMPTLMGFSPPKSRSAGRFGIHAPIIDLARSISQLARNEVDSDHLRCSVTHRKRPAASRTSRLSASG